MIRYETGEGKKRNRLYRNQPLAFLTRAKTKTPTKKFGGPTLNVTRGNVSIGLSTAGRSDQWSERVKAFRFCFPSSQMAKFGDELDYQFGYEDFAWTSILPSTAVISIKLVPFLLSVLFQK